MPEPASTADGVRELLRRLPLFADLPDDDLDRLCDLARRVSFEAGETVMEEGTPGDGLYVIVTGELEVTTAQGGGDLVLARRGPGEMLGEMSLLEQAPRTATVRATMDSDVVVVEPDAFQRLLADSPETASRVLRTMASRLRSTEASLMAREKLASLGTLAAGLAHELNNPAAAIRRATSQLRETTLAWRGWSAQLGRLTLDAAQADRLHALEAEVHAGDGRGAGREVSGSQEPQQSGTRLGPLAIADAEDRLAAFLEHNGVEGAGSAAPPLVAFGWSRERLEPLTGEFDGEQLRIVLGWLATTVAARELLQEIEVSASAISDIVQATKSYSYLDQAPVQDVDLEGTLEDTLTILRHRLKQGVEIVRDYADLPSIEGFGSELTQVWTNLIDNAIHAMEGRGTLELRTRVDPGDPNCVVVEVSDSGPGIPETVRSRMFEPFFTSRPGVGSGLGLHIVHDIVVNRHGGRIEVESRPGRTTFVVHLPRRLRRRAART